MREGVPFHESFVQQSLTDYSAEANQLDFDSSNAAKKINSWVERHTDGHIKEMVKDISPNSVLYLLNAVYFEGAWTEPFRSESTNRAEFYLSDEEAVTVEMMSKGGHYEYAQKDGYEAVRLPLGKGESASLVIFLPDSNRGALHTLQEKLAADPSLVTEPFDIRSGIVDLPKVKIEYSVDLNEDLKGLGMGKAFDPIRADFSRMAPEPPNLFISKVEHKTTLDINEEGASAAAATKVEMMEGAAQPENPFHITINRPFILSIVDRDTGTILFVGTIVNPLG
jgi:serpin B